MHCAFCRSKKERRKKSNVFDEPEKIFKKGVGVMKGTDSKGITKKSISRTWTLLWCAGVLTVCLLWVNVIPAHAADIWSQGKTAAEDIYQNCLKIATPIALASFVVLKIFSLFSHNPRKLDESRELSKKIISTYALIIGAGYLFTYAQKLVGEGGVMTFSLINFPAFFC